MPIHVEGGTAWKEIQAVGDFLMQSNTHARLYREKLSGDGGNTDGGPTPTPEVNSDINLQTGESRAKPTVVTPHQHEVTLTPSEVSKLKAGGNVTKVTSENNGHQHTITIKYHKTRGFYIALCASTPEITRSFANKCKDRHPAVLNVVANA
jgi:hypothetical protein